MALSVIGSGFGRTGTTSLAMALRQLDFGPCHEMQEIFHNPEMVSDWVSFANNRLMDWEQVFKGYESQVDWPGSYVWRELLQAYPLAKVIHTARPEEAWWKSFSATVGKFMNVHHEMPLPPHVHVMVDATIEFIGKQTFGGNWMDKEAALVAYRKRNAEVRAVVAPEQLLIYDVSQGWGPLCDFLGVPEPLTPFPRTNAQEDFWTTLGGEPA